MPEKFSQLGLDVEATGSAADDAKKPQKRGGKGKKWYVVTKIVLTYCEKKIVLAIQKNFRNSRLKAENLQTFWDH